MPTLTNCSHCGRTVSQRAIICRGCGAQLNEVPTAITAELLDDIADDDLPDYLFQFVLSHLSQRRCFNRNGAEERRVLAELPVALRAAYVLVALDSEVNDGGFHQYLTNSSGRLIRETKEALRLIEARQHLGLFEQVVALDASIADRHPDYGRRFDEPEEVDTPESRDAFWADMETMFQPELDRLDRRFYELEGTDSMWPRLVRYARLHPGAACFDASNG